MMCKKLLFSAVLGLFTSASAALADPGVLDCAVAAIVPEDADFFTRGFRAAPEVGDRLAIDFASDQITSMTFADGRILFSPGEGTLTKLQTNLGQALGHAGVRQGSGLYIAVLEPAVALGEDPNLLTSRFAVTKSSRNLATAHIETVATHYADLECRPIAVAD